MSTSINPLFTSGTEISSDALARLGALARQVPIQKQKRVLSDQAGGHLSGIRGRGMEFSEVREYQAGDDLRSMDWRVTARTGKAHIKLFQEERERPVIVCCDLRSTMWFGTRRVLKAVLAADIAAILSWSAYFGGDRVGGVVYNDELEHDVRPNTGRKALTRWLSQLALVEKTHYSDAQQRFAEMGKHLQRIAKPGSSVFIISDWIGFSDDMEHALKMMGRHCDVTAIRIIDPFEFNLPQQSLSLSDGQLKRTLAVTPSIAQQHKSLFERRSAELSQRLSQLKIPLITIKTDDDPITALRAGLGLPIISLPTNLTEQTYAPGEAIASRYNRQSTSPHPTNHVSGSPITQSISKFFDYFKKGDV